MYNSQERNLNKHRFSFEKENRLLTANEYKNVFQNARKIFGESFTTLFCENDFSYPRLGIIVSKRYVKKAVKRNRLKRMIRESFRINKNNISNFDIVILIKQNINSLSKVEFRNKLDELWERLKKS